MFDGNIKIFKLKAGDAIRSTVSAAFLSLAIAACANAESTVTIPVPDSVTNESKNLVLTITVPTSLEKTYQQEKKKDEDKPKKTNYNKYFDLTPFPNMVSKDELAVLKKFSNCGVIEGTSALVVKSGFIANNYEMARTLTSIINTALKMAPEEVAKTGITRSDILDLVKVFDNYTKELKMFQVSGKQRDNLSKLSQKLSFTDGEVKVIKVETNDVGGTVIHLTLNNQKGKYKPQYLSKLEPLSQQTAETQMVSKPPANLNPDSLQFSNPAAPQQPHSDPNGNAAPPDQPLPPPPDPGPAPQPSPEPPAPQPAPGPGGDNGGELPPPPPDLPATP